MCSSCFLSHGAFLLEGVVASLSASLHSKYILCHPIKVIMKRTHIRAPGLSFRDICFGLVRRVR